MFRKEGKELKENFLIFINEYSIYNDEKYNFLEKTTELEKIRNESGNYWTNFFYKAAYHVNLYKKFDQIFKDWLDKESGNFKSYYNKEVYNLSVKKSIKDIETKQKEDESFFNKLSN